MENNKNSEYSKMTDESQTKMISSNQVVPEGIAPQPKPSKSGFMRLLSYTYRHKGLLIIGNVSLMVTSLSFVLIPYLTGQIIDSITEESGREDLNTYTIQFIILMVVASVFAFTRASAYNVLGEKVTLDLRNELFSKLVSKDIEFFDHNRSGELISRLTSDISVIQSGASDTISILLRNLIQFIGSLGLLWFISWKLTLMLIAVIPPFVILVGVFIVQYKKYTKLYQSITAESTQIATEVLGNMRVVRSFSTEPKEVQAYGQATNKAYGIGLKRALLGGVFQGIGFGIGNLVILGILYYGGTLVLDGELSVGALSSFVLYTLTMTFSLLSVSGMINIMVQSAAVSEKVFSLMDEEVKILNGQLKSDTLSGVIEFDDVSFAYPSKQTVSVLKNIKLTINAGEVVAFVGQSGSGKSTIVSLLERFYDASEGQVMIDGKNIRDYDIADLHKAIGYVSQEPTLFSGTLEENITYGVLYATQQEIENAMKLANAYDFVTNKDVFPEGLKTIVGERGVKLSGGQKQRIAISRALIKNPKILIFDEATSALDAESEYQVQQAIDGLVQGGSKTIIIIAHRLSTIINSHKIVVVQNGLIAEVGTHQQLLAQNNVYKQLIERQLS